MPKYSLTVSGIIFGLFMVMSPSANSASGLSASEILSRADTIRFPPGDHSVSVTISFSRPGRSPDIGRYEVMTKGYDKTLIKITEPATEHGNSILMLGRDLWVFIKDVSKPVRISFQQRLMGDVANGDLARANFVGDYTPKLLKETSQYYLLSLAAKNEDVTYHRVLLVVEKQTFHPLKAQFFAESGKLLKNGTYEDYRPLAGAIRPTRLVFDNPLAKGQKSTLSYTSMSSDDFPDKYFTKDYLKKLKY